MEFNLAQYKTHERLIIALDIDNMEEIKRVVETLGDSISFYKVGLKSFLLTNGEVVSYLKSLNKRIFLDLKFYDIPETVKTATLFPIKEKVDFFTVHASMGYNGLKAVSDILEEEKSHSLALAVTVLTSFSETDFQETYQSDLPISNSVVHLGNIAKNAGIKGLVCSAKEAGLVKQYIGKEIISVCPGIRLENDSHDDQTRVLTPYLATKNGADFLVMGRSIIQTNKAQENIKEILEQVEKGMYEYSNQ